MQVYDIINHAKIATYKDLPQERTLAVRIGTRLQRTGNAGGRSVGGDASYLSRVQAKNLTQNRRGGEERIRMVWYIPLLFYYFP